MNSLVVSSKCIVSIWFHPLPDIGITLWMCAKVVEALFALALAFWLLSAIFIYSFISISIYFNAFIVAPFLTASRLPPLVVCLLSLGKVRICFAAKWHKALGKCVKMLSSAGPMGKRLQNQKAGIELRALFQNESESPGKARRRSILCKHLCARASVWVIIMPVWGRENLK